MNIKEALVKLSELHDKIYNNNIVSIYDVDVVGLYDALGYAINSVEMSIPKPTVNNGCCPNCGEEIVYDIDGCYGTEHIRPNYCSKCGQAIEISEPWYNG